MRDCRKQGDKFCLRVTDDNQGVEAQFGNQLAHKNFVKLENRITKIPEERNIIKSQERSSNFQNKLDLQKENKEKI